MKKVFTDKLRMMSVLVLVLAACAFGDVISLESLLNEMIDRAAIARYPEPAFTCKQFSSYDRHSTKPGNDSWFANRDWSHFIRSEENYGRREWVMMDVDGPGAIVRWWITGFAFNGTIRVYIDGSSTPVFEGKADKLIGGDLLIGAPLSAERSKGRNLYLPIPYRQHCKVTYDGENAHENGNFNDNLYYNINYRTYPKETNVRSFSMEQFNKSKSLIESLQSTLLEAEGASESYVDGLEKTLKPGKSLERKISGPAAICELSMSLDAEIRRQALRSTVLQISFDGQQTVWAPVGEFFGTGVGINPYKCWWRQTEQDVMTCRWIMPFKKECVIKVANYGDQDVQVKLGKTGLCDWIWDNRTMCFHSAWRGQNDMHMKITTNDDISDTTRDWNHITIDGKGVYVGETLALYNHLIKITNPWWGEGDEKVFVDSESFPSHFGTGTEDYYGYAWCWPGEFTSPFHAQPRGRGNSKSDHTTNTRERLLDGIPFTRSLQFDMELWHWSEAKLDYATTTYWYAFAGGKDNGMKDVRKIAEPVKLTNAEKSFKTENGTVLLQAKDAILSGNNLTYYGGSRDELGYWGLKGDFASWKVNFAQAGTYAVEIVQGSMSKEGTSYRVEISNDQHSDSLTARPVNTEEWSIHTTVKPGTIKVALPGFYTVSVKPEHIPEGEYLMNLGHLKLSKIE